MTPTPKPCGTCHLACDCREAKFASLESALNSEAYISDKRAQERNAAETERDSFRELAARYRGTLEVIAAAPGTCVCGRADDAREALASHPPDPERDALKRLEAAVMHSIQVNAKATQEWRLAHDAPVRPEFQAIIDALAELDRARGGGKA